MIERLTVLGVGLIGGSVALGAKKSQYASTIIGFDANPENLNEALTLGVIDEIALSIVDACQSADLVVFSVPVGSLESVLLTLKAHWSHQCVYTDVGSSKSDVIAALIRVFGFIPPNFVPGHPIAGLERSGAIAAKEDLFQNKRIILTPTIETDEAALTEVIRLWQCLGGLVSTMEPQHHDEVLAATSHLPHVLAFVLTAMLGKKDEKRHIFKYAAGGFRDFTRIASSDPTMWSDICVANQSEIVPLLREYASALEQTALWMESSQKTELYHLFLDARHARQRYLDQSEK
jgi:prephenate dehydrogenase